MKKMSTDYVRGLYFHKYGISLGVGIGVPIPILDEGLMKSVSISNEQIVAPVLDYSVQSRARKPLTKVSYAQLRSGTIKLHGKNVKTSSLSSYRRAKDIAEKLKKWMEEGEFLLSQPVANLHENQTFKPLDLHSQEEV
jgi:uncharacterized protein (DUF39 family)